jgi:hypothetical protein
MGLSFLKTRETRNNAARAACTPSWISIAWLASLSFAACEPAEQDDTGRTMMPSVPATGGPGAGMPGGGAAWPPPGTGGGTQGGATSGGTWPVATDAGLGGLPDAGLDAPTARPCNRDIQSVMIDRFFLALKAHDVSSLPFARDVKFTENGRQLRLGEGIWKTAGASSFKHTAYDVATCNTVTEAVIAEGTEMVPMGVRLKFAPPAPGTTASASQEILEVELIVARPGTYSGPSDPTTLATAGESEMWEQLVPASQRATRAQLEQMLDEFFVHFPAGACHFSPQCTRLENGFSPGACSAGFSCAPAGAGQNARPRLKVIDVEAGIAVGFAMVGNTYTNLNMFRVRGGQVQSLHSILASATSPGW